MLMFTTTALAKTQSTTMSTVHTTLDYDRRQENKSIDLIMVPRKYWVYKQDSKSYEIFTVPINIIIEYSQNAHPCTHRTSQPHRQSTKLRIMTISIRIKVLVQFGAFKIMCVELRAKQLWNVYQSYWTSLNHCVVDLPFLIYIHL
jgi:hypothetical protein